MYLVQFFVIYIYDRCQHLRFSFFRILVSNERDAWRYGERHGNASRGHKLNAWWNEHGTQPGTHCQVKAPSQALMSTQGYPLPDF